jgi:hypothetical protein
VVLQITPSSKTKPHRLPTEQDFLVIANDANMHKAAPSKDLREAIAVTPNAQARSTLESARASLSSAKLQFDVGKRQYWFTGEAHDETAGTIDVFSLATFLLNGNLVQVSGYSDAQAFPTMMPEFRAMGRSVRSTSIAPAQR